MPLSIRSYLRALVPNYTAETVTPIFISQRRPKSFDLPNLELEMTRDSQSASMAPGAISSDSSGIRDSQHSKKRKREQPKLAATPTEKRPKTSIDNTRHAAQDGEERENQAQEPSNTPKTFSDLGIIESLCDACTQLGFKTPTPIQTEAIPLALQKRDIIGLAETGSGKTAAFALPILQALMEKPQNLFGLVLAPTRELAYQTSQQFQALGSLISVKTAVIVGGMDMVSQQIALGKNPHIVVATPGRLLDHLENTKGFSLRHLKYLVMDEADRLLDMDFGPILDKILKVLPREGRKTMLFSATMSSKVESLQRASLSNPLRVAVSADPTAADLGGTEATSEEKQALQSAKHRTVATLLQSFIFLPHKHKDHYLLALLSGPFSGQSCICFARTVHEVSRLTLLLRALGVGAIPLHGQLSQSSRLSALNKFKAHSRDVLVATDVAARGLDIPSVDLVLNYDLPGDSKTYVHRVGRTARAGKSGHAISMVSQYDVEVWMRIERALGRKVEQYQGVGKDEALALSDSVGEAQRVAVRGLKDEASKKERKRERGKGKLLKAGREDMDAEEG